MKWLGSILLNALIFLFLSLFIQSFHVENFNAAFLASFILGLINVLVRPILVILTFPITLLTLGTFLFVINALMLLLTNKIIGPSFVIDGFGTALLIALFMALLNLILNVTVLKKPPR